MASEILNACVTYGNLERDTFGLREMYLIQLCPKLSVKKQDVRCIRTLQVCRVNFY